MAKQKNHKDLSYNLCGKCIYWDGKICIITKVKTTEDTPCSDDENFCQGSLHNRNNRFCL